VNFIAKFVDIVLFGNIAQDFIRISAMVMGTYGLASGPPCKALGTTLMFVCGKNVFIVIMSGMKKLMYLCRNCVI
jgi:hypothetical protein